MEAPKTSRASRRAKAVTQMQRSRIQMGSALEFHKRGRDSQGAREKSCPKLAIRTDLVLTLENERKGSHNRQDSSHRV